MTERFAFWWAVTGLAAWFLAFCAGFVFRIPLPDDPLAFIALAVLPIAIAVGPAMYDACRR